MRFLSALALAAAAFAALAQSPAPRFEVVSVKSTAEGGEDMRGQGTVRLLPGGRLNAEKASLRYFIENAFGVKPFQLLGGPGWLVSAHYDIDARAQGDPPADQMRLMMQALLADRFQLRTHRETRQLPVYELTAAKSGIKLPPATDCAAAPAAAPGPCGRILMQFTPAGGRLQGKQVTIAELVRVLSNVLARTVIDRTGFTGTFDARLEFAPDEALAGLPTPAGANDPRVPTLPPDPNHPTIFAALEQQLGIHVASTRGPVEVIVIDSAERPSGN